MGSSGIGNISIGYLGSLMDTATGLLYVGNGQYYDPSTGRFLNRNANPNGTNPYVPWGGEPSATLMAPLALLSLLYSRRKKRGTLDTIVILLVLGMSLGLGLAACNGVTPPPPTVVVTIATTAPAPGSVVGSATVTANGTPVATGPVVVPIPCPTVTMAFTQAPIPQTHARFDKIIFICGIHDGTPQSGIKVYAFNGTTYTNYSGTTDASGQVTFTLPQGNYRFRTDFNGTQYWSSSVNHCALPGCTTLTVIVGPQPTATVTATSAPTATATTTAIPTATATSTPEPTSSPTEEATPTQTATATPTATSTPEPTATASATETAIPTPSEALTAVPTEQSYFQSGGIALVSFKSPSKAVFNGSQTDKRMAMDLPVTVTIQDTDGAAQSGIKVYAFDGTTYKNYSGTTDANGHVTLSLPDGSYRFRADFNGTQFWSADTNTCIVPTCVSASVTVTKPLTVTVQSQTGDAYPNLPVYAFDPSTGSGQAVYTGFHGTTDANGQVTFTLPQGNYRFRADYDGVQFWSAQTNQCTLPGCTSATVTLPGGTAETTTTIDCTYDPLNRLKEANYDNGDYYHYGYDAVGNRLTQENLVNGLPSTVNYQYDIANRLINVNGADYTWDANGNLLKDGVNTYAYDSANRLASFTSPTDSATYAYNGLRIDFSKQCTMHW